MEVKEILSKGVPTQLVLPMEISIIDLIKICKKTTNLEEQIKKAEYDFYNKVIDKCGNRTADFLRLKKLAVLEVYTDPETLVSNLIVSSANIFNRIANLINDYSLCYYDFNAIDRAINNLREISEVDFESKYPTLYSMYKDLFLLSKTWYIVKNNFKRMSYLDRKSRISTYAQLNSLSEKTVEYYIQTAKSNYTYKDFIKEFIYVLETIKNSIDELISPSIDSQSTLYVNSNIEVNEEDLENLGMYITYCYQEMLKSVKPEFQQDYLYYISEYYFENRDFVNTKKKLYLPSFDKIISINSMYQEYRQILINNPNLRLVQFHFEDFKGMTMEQVNEFMEAYFNDLKASWEFFEGTKVEDETILKIMKYYKNQTSVDDNELKKIIEMFMKKKEFFDKTDPYYRVLGKNTFDRYIGYIYSNGMVVLEKFFENSNIGKLAQNQAIYIMNIEEFYSLTKLSKNEIISKKLCKRFIHKGDWQQRVLNVINSKMVSSPVNGVQDLTGNGLIRK